VRLIGAVNFFPRKSFLSRGEHCSQVSGLK
jgi:hypothetical protein